jgi:thiamine pyrophosphokinase
LSRIENLSIKGAKWDIDNENIPYGSTRTLRNSALSEEIFIEAKNGKFCLIVKN